MPTSWSRDTTRRVRDWLNSEPVASLREDFDELLTRFFGGAEGHAGESRMMAAMDVYETDAAIEVWLDVPGVRPDDLEIKVSGHTLTISGHRREQREERGRTCHQAERRFGHFSRNVALPCPVEHDRVEARASDGVLVVTLPKVDADRPRRVPVKPAGAPWPGGELPG